jgi:hypothetical protein
LYAVRVRGREVDIEEITGKKMETVLRLANTPGNQILQGYRTAMQGLRISIRGVAEVLPDGQVGPRRPLSFEDLQDDKLYDLFSTAELQLLGAAWNKIHMPTDDEVEGLGNGISPISGR